MARSGRSTYAVTELYPSVIEVALSMQDAKTEHWFLLRSDVHHDNAHSQRKVEKKHLDQAVERGAGIIDNGDLFCAMQGKWDKRSDQTQLRPEHRGDDYLDLLSKEAADFYGPYAKNWIAFGTGNHETSVLKRHGHDLTRTLVTKLNDRHDTHIPFHGYAGWILFRLSRGKQQKTVRMLRHHGLGGGGRQNRGITKSLNLGADFPDAHIIVQGHDHNEYIFGSARRRIGEGGKPYMDEQIHVRIPGYCVSPDEFNGWHIEKGMHPRTVGAAWLRVWRESHDFRYEVTRAT